MPYVFTEYGALMAANILKSAHAIDVSVYVVRAFVKLKEALVGHKDIAAKLGLLEKKVGRHDKKIRIIIQTIQEMIEPIEEPAKRRIGFHSDKE